MAGLAELAIADLPAFHVQHRLPQPLSHVDDDAAVAAADADAEPETAVSVPAPPSLRLAVVGSPMRSVCEQGGEVPGRGTAPRLVGTAVPKYPARPICTVRPSCSSQYEHGGI